MPATVSMSPRYSCHHRAVTDGEERLRALVRDCAWFMAVLAVVRVAGDGDRGGRPARTRWRDRGLRSAGTGGSPRRGVAAQPGPGEPGRVPGAAGAAPAGAAVAGD